MAGLTLEAARRKTTGKQVRALRREGKLPGVIYGAGIEATPIELDARQASKVLGRTTRATLVDVVLEGETHPSLVREIQRDPIRRIIRHVDLLKVAMDQTIRAEVPIELIGEAPAVKTLGGVLVAGVNAIQVEALPANLPDRVVVDLKVLVNIDDAITVGSLSLGAGVEVLTDSDSLVARVIYQAEEIIEAPVVAAVVAEPEVISKPTKEEDEDEKES
ncbi:MAG: 50S ribosomal protein L25 [Anaerolineales bacterium]|nr:50S ribosomal protein L25 [Anaerolineales bacterium]